MPLDKSTVPNEEELASLGGDPDNPVDDQAFIGQLTVTARVHIGEGTVVPSYGAEDDARILDTCRKYAEKAGNYEHALWFLEAEGISVVRTDGEPWRSHETIKIQSADGRNLGKNMAHAKLAEAFTAHGVSASYAKAGGSDSALGHVFLFGSENIKLGKSYEKAVRMFPREHFGPVADFTYDVEKFGEIREVTPRSTEESATEANPVSQISDEEAISRVVKALEGKAPSEMMDAVLDPANNLEGVTTVFGVPLVEAATDESLAAVLEENKVMHVVAGTLTPMTPVGTS